MSSSSSETTASADFLFQVSDTTWNAYNRWPSQFSLYDDGKKEWYWGPNVQTSFDRPYGKYCQVVDAPLSVGSGEFLLWEFPLAYWMEQQGYDVSYISNLDTHADPASLRRAKGWLSVGHDEYWSLAMFETMKKMVSKGLNLAFLSGNSICGVIDIHPSSDGRPDRIIERVGRFGSPRKEEIEKGFPEEALFIKNGPNEATLMGAQSTYPVTGGGDWICRQPDHWLFAGTGMKEGDGIPGLVGWEWHGEPAKIPGLEIVASGKTQSPRAEGTYTATIYPGPEGNFVFNAATIWWADGLSEPPGYVRPAVYTRPQGPDPRVQRITRNLLERMRGLRKAGPTRTPPMFQPNLRQPPIRLFLPAFLMSAVLTNAGSGAVPEPARPIDFSREVRPILANYCFPCHGPDDKARKAGLRLDSRRGASASCPGAIGPSYPASPANAGPRADSRPGPERRHAAAEAG